MVICAGHKKKKKGGIKALKRIPGLVEFDVTWNRFDKNKDALLALVVKEDTQEPVPDLLIKTGWFSVEEVAWPFSVLNSAQG